MASRYAPWGTLAKKMAQRRGRKPVEPIKHWKIVKGDTVEILDGKDAGHRGVVEAVIRSQNRVLVEGGRTVEKRTPAQNGQPASVLRLSTPVHYSSVALIDPADNLPTTVEYRFFDGKRVRTSVRSGRIIPKPDFRASPTYQKSATYVEGSKDTREAAVLEKTFTPSAVPFAQSIYSALGSGQSLEVGTGGYFFASRRKFFRLPRAFRVPKYGGPKDGHYNYRAAMAKRHGLPVPEKTERELAEES